MAYVKKKKKRNWHGNLSLLTFFSPYFPAHIAFL